MGLQVSGTAADTEVNIKGNIYTASDYYNKDYNGKTDTKVTNEYSRTVETKWGSTDESAYSGIFVQGDRANLTLNSDIIVNSGSLAALMVRRLIFQDVHPCYQNSGPITSSSEVMRADRSKRQQMLMYMMIQS
jgi:hypothetical protein